MDKIEFLINGIQTHKKNEHYQIKFENGEVKITTNINQLRIKTFNLADAYDNIQCVRYLEQILIKLNRRGMYKC